MQLFYDLTACPIVNIQIQTELLVWKSQLLSFKIGYFQIPNHVISNPKSPDGTHVPGPGETFTRATSQEQETTGPLSRGRFCVGKPSST